MRPPFIACVLVLVASVALTPGCSSSSQVRTPPVASVSTTMVDTSAPLSAEDSETLAVHGRLMWTGPLPVSLGSVRSLLATAPWAIYPTRTFGRRLIGIFYAKDVPGKGQPADYATLVYQGGILVEAARYQQPGIETLTTIFHARSQTGEKQWGDIVQVGPFSAISSEVTGGVGVGPGKPKGGAISVGWIADDVIYSVEGGYSGHSSNRPSSLPLADILAMARSAVRAPKRTAPDPKARADAASTALLRSLETSGGRLLPDNFAAFRLFPNTLWPEDTLGRRLVAIVYNRIPQHFRNRVSARRPVSAIWYPRLTLIYEDGLTVSEELQGRLDELTFERLRRESGFSVKQPTDALGIPAYFRPGRLEFMPFDLHCTVDAPQLDRKQLEQVARSMLP